MFCDPYPAGTNRPQIERITLADKKPTRLVLSAVEANPVASPAYRLACLQAYPDWSVITEVSSNPL